MTGQTKILQTLHRHVDQQTLNIEENVSLINTHNLVRILNCRFVILLYYVCNFEYKNILDSISCSKIVFTTKSRSWKKNKESK